MTSKKSKIKKFIMKYQGAINPSYLAEKLEMNKKTVRTYLNELKDEIGLIKQQKGKYVFYTYKQPLDYPQIFPKYPLLMIHDLHILLPLSHLRQEGCLNKLFIYETEKEKLGALLNYCFPNCPNIYQFKPKFRSGESTTIDGKFYSKDGKRSIYFKLSWGNEAIKKNGCPSLFLIIGCTQSPLDLNGFKWLEHHISSSFGTDLTNAIVKEHGLGIDLEEGHYIRNNQTNMAYHLFKDYYLEEYEKEFEDGEKKLRIAAHIKKDIPYPDIANIIQGLGETNGTGERLSALIEVMNEHSRLISQLCTNVTLMTKSFNQLIILNNTKGENSISKEWYR